MRKSDITQPSHWGDVFLYVYGAEAVLPLEVIMGSLRVQAYNKTAQDQLRREDIDLIDERKWQSAIKNAQYQ
jgi:hypothetical protein